MSGIALRIATPGDWTEIRRLHEEQNQKQGTDYEAPRPGPHIAVALVAEDQQGVIRQAVIVERVAEMAIYGMDSRATAASQRDIAGLAFILRSQGFRWLHCLVPRALHAWIKKPLKRAGFEDRAEEIANFTIQVSQ